MSRFLFIDPHTRALLADEPVAVGGASVQALNWMLGLRDLGHDVGCVVDRPVDTAERRGLRTIAGYRAAGGLGYITAQRPFLEGVLREYEPDYVYQGAAGALTGLLAHLCRRHRTRFLYRMANDADADARVRRRLRIPTLAAYRYGLSRASAILCQTKYQEDRLKAARLDTPMVRLPNPIRLGPAAEGGGMVTGRYLAWVGVFKRQKDLAGLLELARMIPEVPIAIAGGAPARVDPGTAAAVAALRDMPNVRLAGYLRRQEVPEFLAGAWALVSTSRYEGFPNTFLEAWAVGTPTFATRASDPDSVIERESLGGVAETAAGLAPALRSLACRGRDEGLRQRCLAYVRAHHEATAVAGRLTEWLDHVFGGR